MSGAINFAMSDIYGGVFGTTEKTIPEAADQTALVDDQKASADVSDVNGNKKKLPVALAIVLVIVVAFIVGGAK